MLIPVIFSASCENAFWT